MSDQPIGEQVSFHFHFWKEHVWVWVLLLPLGIVCWSFPFLILLSAAFADFPTAARIMLGCGFLGIPGYLVGYIFIYNFMDFVFTRVVLSQENISFRTPWAIFPVVLRTKKIPAAGIRQIRIGLDTGMGRPTVQVEYQTENDERHRRVSLPRFKDERYLPMIRTLQEKIELRAGHGLQSQTPELAPAVLQAKEGILRARARGLFRPDPGERIMSILIGLSILAFFVICSWITSSIPGISKVDAISIGLAVGFPCFWITLLGLYPVIGQAAIWFLGRLVIGAVLWLYQAPNPVWDTPPEVNRLLAVFHLSPIHSTLTEFVFWGVMFLSILLSVNVIRGSLRRREIKKYMKGEGE
ncbi:MAG: hypothetical protein ABSC61_07120 [Anaerolineales bacterium]